MEAHILDKTLVKVIPVFIIRGFYLSYTGTIGSGLIKRDYIETLTRMPVNWVVKTK